MAWQGYVDNLMDDDSVKDAAIVGYTDNKSVLAAHAGGVFNSITSEQIDALVREKRTLLFAEGVTLGSLECIILRDNSDVDKDWTMDMRTKSQEEEPAYNISVGRGEKVLVLVMGKEGVHGGGLNKKAYSKAKYLSDSGF